MEPEYIASVPRMAYYTEYRIRIYQIFLKYIEPEKRAAQFAPFAAQTVGIDLM